MKTFLIIAAVLGLTSSAAFAECAGHDVTASVKVDRQATTASTVPATEKTIEEALLKRQPAEAQTEVTK